MNFATVLVVVTAVPFQFITLRFNRSIHRKNLLLLRLVQWLSVILDWWRLLGLLRFNIVVSFVIICDINVIFFISDSTALIEVKCVCGVL